MNLQQYYLKSMGIQQWIPRKQSIEKSVTLPLNHDSQLTDGRNVGYIYFESTCVFIHDLFTENTISGQQLISDLTRAVTHITQQKPKTDHLTVHTKLSNTVLNSDGPIELEIHALNQIITKFSAPIIFLMGKTFISSLLKNQLTAGKSELTINNHQIVLLAGPVELIENPEKKSSIWRTIQKNLSTNN